MQPRLGQLLPPSTPVECTAEDNAGNIASVSFTASVVDANAGVSPSITLAQSQEAGPGETVTASTAGETHSGLSGVTATLTNGAGGTASLTVASYAGNPSSVTYFDAGGRFTDVMVQGAGQDAQATVNFYYPTGVPDYTYYPVSRLYYGYRAIYAWDWSTAEKEDRWFYSWFNFYSYSFYWSDSGTEFRECPYGYGSCADDILLTYRSYYDYSSWDWGDPSEGSRGYNWTFRGDGYFYGFSEVGSYFWEDTVEVPHSLTYFDGSVWAPVLSSGGVPPEWNTQDHLDGTNSHGRFTVVFDMTSTPKITELAGTVFGDGKDTTPPVLSGVPADTTVEATNSVGATTTYAVPTATDNLDGPLTVTCTPAPGDFFPLGLTTVTCEARDNSGNTGTASFEVQVQDTAPPALRALISPEPNANGWHNSQVAVSLSASDVSSGVQQISYSINGGPPVVELGGNTNTLISEDGVYNISYTATDKAGNASPPETLTVKLDTTPPTVTVSRVPDPNTNG